MIEDESYRPKVYLFICFSINAYISQLFIVGRGRLAGQEEEFPGPDNPSKLRRSIANADTRGMSLNFLFSQRTWPSPAIHFCMVLVAIPFFGLQLIHHTLFLQSLTHYLDGGLYPARTGQAMRDAQRSRSSPYDRGTTAAEYEAYMQGLSTGRNILATGRFLTLTAPPQIPGFYRY